jgi:hypothetical protein
MLHRMSRVRAFVGALAITLLGASPLSAGILNVPGDAATIQGAIGLAADGDTILVAPGTYVETIDLLGKRLVIESTGGAAVTTIDGNGGGSTVSVKTGEPVGTAIRGFTITGGTGQDVQHEGFFTPLDLVHGGGGVLVGTAAHPSNVELSNCVITGNSVVPPGPTPAFNCGGGVYLSDGKLVLKDCTLSGNTARSGAALAMLGFTHSFTATHCTITGNTATDGPAIWSQAGNGWLTDSTITDNSGNGLGLSGNQFHAARCIVRGNSGWGLTSYGFSGPDVIGFDFLGNGLGGAACFGGSGGASDLVKDCIFANGDGLSLGCLWSDISNCSFDGTSIVAPPSIVTITNCIGRGTTTVTGYASLAVTYSDMVGWGAGTGNIDTDPLWVDAGNDDYRLLPASPCIDAGDPGSPLDPDGTRVDMGAVRFKNAFDDLGGGVAGTAGSVVLAAHGTLVGGEGVVFKLSGTTPFKSTLLILGASALGVPFKGGTMWPTLGTSIPLAANGTGQLTLSTTWPATIPSGFQLWAQFWHPDTGAVYGFAGSNGVRGTVP